MIHMSISKGVELGYSSDRRIRRRQHRNAAKRLLLDGGIFNHFCCPGTSYYIITRWHLMNARRL